METSSTPTTNENHFKEERMEEKELNKEEKKRL
jgi:hypothetical protein